MSHNVHIIGGGGGIGRWFAVHAFQGHRVFCYDISSKNLLDIPAMASGRLVENDDFGAFADQFQPGDWVILAVPLQAFSGALAGVLAVTKRGTLFVCFTSVQARPLREMKRQVPSDCSYFGCHPLFGHVVSSPAGQIIACAGYRKSDDAHVEFLDCLKDVGLIPTFLTAVKHDQAMAFVQALTHFSLLGVLKALDDSKLPLESLTKLKTPNFQFLLAFASRIIRQAPTTLGAIQSTVEAAFARDLLIRALTGLNGELEKNDAASCGRVLDGMRRRFIDKAEVAEGVEVAALAVDGLQRFEELLLRYRENGDPFVFRHRTTHALKIVRILDIGHDHIRYEEATKKVIRSDGKVRYAVGLTESARENYNRMGFASPKARVVRIKKGNVKLLTTEELVEFHRLAMIPAETLHTFDNAKEFPREFFEGILPSLVPTLYKCELIDKFETNVLLRLTYDPNVGFDHLVREVELQLAPQLERDRRRVVTVSEV